MLKTDNMYNDDDFAQVGDQMNELTVTITLCEYRNMVRELARNEIEIEKLKDSIICTLETTEENDCAYWSNLDGTKKQAGTEAYPFHCTNCGGVPMYEQCGLTCLSKYCPHCGKYMGLKRITENGIDTITAEQRFGRKGGNDDDK